MNVNKSPKFCQIYFTITENSAIAENPNALNIKWYRWHIIHLTHQNRSTHKILDLRLVSLFCVLWFNHLSKFATALFDIRHQNFGTQSQHPFAVYTSVRHNNISVFSHNFLHFLQHFKLFYPRLSIPKTVIFGNHSLHSRRDPTIMTIWIKWPCLTDLHFLVIAISIVD